MDNEKLVNALKAVRQAFIDNDVTAKDNKIGNHPWIPGLAAPAIIKIVEEALASQPVAAVSDERLLSAFNSGATVIDGLHEVVALLSHPAAQQYQEPTKREMELEAARIAYASEFPLTTDNEPDVDNIHANIRKLKAQLAQQPSETAIPKTIKTVDVALLVNYARGALTWSDDLEAAVKRLEMSLRPAAQEVNVSDSRLAQVEGLLKTISDNYAKYHAGDHHPDVVRARELLRPAAQDAEKPCVCEKGDCVGQPNIPEGFRCRDPYGYKISGQEAAREQPESEKWSVVVHATDDWPVTFIASDKGRSMECSGMTTEQAKALAERLNKSDVSRIVDDCFSERENELHRVINVLQSKLIKMQAGKATDGFQQRVQPWMAWCFTPEICRDTRERAHRFYEEATELVQAAGMPKEHAYALVDYVYGRPVGELPQEVGGVMVTLAAFCLAYLDLDMHECGEVELKRINQPEIMHKIRAKQAAKRDIFGPLP